MAYSIGIVGARLPHVPFFLYNPPHSPPMYACMHVCIEDIKDIKDIKDITDIKDNNIGVE
jgi:hypothetical protein